MLKDIGEECQYNNLFAQEEEVYDDFLEFIRMKIETFRLENIGDHTEIIDTVHERLTLLPEGQRNEIFGDRELEAKNVLLSNLFRPAMTEFDISLSDNAILLLAKYIDPRLIQDYAVVLTYDAEEDNNFVTLNNAVGDEQHSQQLEEADTVRA